MIIPKYKEDFTDQLISFHIMMWMQSMKFSPDRRMFYGTKSVLVKIDQHEFYKFILSFHQKFETIFFNCQGLFLFSQPLNYKSSVWCCLYDKYKGMCIWLFTELYIDYAYLKNLCTSWAVPRLALRSSVIFCSPCHSVFKSFTIIMWRKGYKLQYFHIVKRAFSLSLVLLIPQLHVHLIRNEWINKKHDLESE